MKEEIDATVLLSGHSHGTRDELPRGGIASGEHAELGSGDEVDEGGDLLVEGSLVLVLRRVRIRGLVAGGGV